MWTHPIGITGLTLSEVETWTLSTQVGTTTHADPRCKVSVCIIVSLIRSLLRGETSSESDIDAAIERSYAHVCSVLPKKTHQLEREYFEKHVHALSFEDLELDNRQRMGYVYKCLGSVILSLRLVMRSSTSPLPSQSLFEEIITDLIMYGGDADTNAAVAGSFPRYLSRPWISSGALGHGTQA